MAGLHFFETHWDHEPGRDAFHRVSEILAKTPPNEKSGTEWNLSLPRSWRASIFSKRIGTMNPVGTRSTASLKFSPRPRLMRNQGQSGICPYHVHGGPPFFRNALGP